MTFASRSNKQSSNRAALTGGFSCLWALLLYAYLYSARIWKPVTVAFAWLSLLETVVMGVPLAIIKLALECRSECILTCGMFFDYTNSWNHDVIVPGYIGFPSHVVNSRS